MINSPSQKIVKYFSSKCPKLNSRPYLPKISSNIDSVLKQEMTREELKSLGFRRLGQNYFRRTPTGEKMYHEGLSRKIYIRLR